MNTTKSRKTLSCEFLERIHADLSSSHDWLQGAIIASGGAGNPKGSHNAVSDLARKHINQIVNRCIDQFRNEPVDGQSTFDRIFFESTNEIEGAACLGGGDTLFAFGRAQKLLNIALKYCYAWYWCHGKPSPAFGELAWIERWSLFLHVPVDRNTIQHMAHIQQTQHLGQSGTYLVSWKQFLDKPRYCRIQDAVRNLAMTGGYQDPLHYEMDNIW